jgi:hypothetical protein
MRIYTQQHRFYAGSDLHARTLYLHVLDAGGRTRFDRNLPARPDALLQTIAPCHDGLVVGVECMVAWHCPGSPTSAPSTAGVDRAGLPR